MMRREHEPYIEVSPPVLIRMRRLALHDHELKKHGNIPYLSVWYLASIADTVT